ncbi:MAG: bifunctional 5,10-methylene-tetrahydrofolate dehydrogenase/5,10-methylene-tetrahydrofolate cyclohydrolase [Planctomycetota bacterium]|nr:bifunctional 5,10-methylene-tetrahydrofolate dehydrogenase/5,10-methylene-tetrahydrofolate cyclohydrolase [Planctomycetota bacterium]
MTARILDGKTLAMQIRKEIAGEVATLTSQRGIVPCLAAVLVGDDPASQVYVRNKEIACEKAGLQSRLFRMPVTTTTSELLELLAQLNRDAKIHGILVQLPLPKQINERQVLDAVLPAKDVDAFSPENVGLISQGRPRFLPCTPHGVLQLLGRCDIETSGKEVVVVGRSDIVGKPLVSMFLQKTGPLGQTNANATVTCCHSQSTNLAEITRRADILVVAIGKANFITADMVRPGAVVIDVGINRLGEKIVGDVDFEAVSQVAGAITPVPGGIGPLTIAMLLQNTLAAAKAGQSQTQA